MPSAQAPCTSAQKKGTKRNSDVAELDLWSVWLQEEISTSKKRREYYEYKTEVAKLKKQKLELELTKLRTNSM